MAAQIGSDSNPYESPNQRRFSALQKCRRSTGTDGLLTYSFLLLPLIRRDPLSKRDRDIDAGEVDRFRCDLMKILPVSEKYSGIGTGGQASCPEQRKHSQPQKAHHRKAIHRGLIPLTDQFPGPGSLQQSPAAAGSFAPASSATFQLPSGCLRQIVM